MPFVFKGDDFQNFYRVEGILTAASPIHIGTGEFREDVEIKAKIKEKSADDESTEHAKIAEIERDFKGKPIIPGSTIRGVIRNYILNIFCGLDKTIANLPDYEDATFKKSQSELIEYMKTASLLEQLFGTPFCESKIEFWDAPLTNPISNIEFASKGWDAARQSYVIRSVAIDPQTGAAEHNKLYSFEVIPAGLKFKLNITGRNLSNLELGMLFFGMEGFNSPIFPLTIGAKAGRGLGRMSFELEHLYKLSKDQLPQWLDFAKNTEASGYDLLVKFKLPNEQVSDFLRIFKQTFADKVKGGPV